MTAQPVHIAIPAFAYENPVRAEVLEACRGAARDRAPHLLDPVLEAIAAGVMDVTLAIETWDPPAFASALLQAAALANHFSEQQQEAAAQSRPSADSYAVAAALFMALYLAIYPHAAGQWGQRRFMS